MKYKIEFVISNSGTLMAKTFHNNNCLVEYGDSYEEAEAKLIRSLKIIIANPPPPPKEVEIEL